MAGVVATLRGVLEELKVRKRPVVVEAVQWNEANYDEILETLGATSDHIRPAGYGELFIETLEGDRIARPGHWIIRGVAGEFYSCSSEIFAETYELVDNDGVMVAE